MSTLTRSICELDIGMRLSIDSFLTQSVCQSPNAPYFRELSLDESFFCSNDPLFF
jgi:hypothetical protein